VSGLGVSYWVFWLLAKQQLRLELDSLYRASQKTQNAPRMQLTMYGGKTPVGKLFGHASAGSMHLPNNVSNIQTLLLQRETLSIQNHME
jgi:hypothetical protein